MAGSDFKNKSLKEKAKQGGNLAVMGFFVVAGVIMVVSWFGPGKTGAKKEGNLFKGRSGAQVKKETAKKETFQEKDNPSLFTADVDIKAYVTRLEQQYSETTTKVDKLTEKLVSLETTLKNVEKNQAFTGEKLLGLDEKIEKKINTSLQQAGVSQEGSLLGDIGLGAAGTQKPAPGLQLEIADIGEVRGPSKEYVYLPAGSFCEGTLITGVYALANAGTLVPVLIMLDSAYVGPNKSKIPLKGAFVQGKAMGEMVSKRAIIQVIALSTVQNSDKVFETEGNLGYVAGEDGILGVPGKPVSMAASMVTLGFMSGFTAGMSEALAQAETTSTTSESGQVARNVTGNIGQYGAFSGLARSASDLSEYLAKKRDQLVDAIMVKPGAKVIVVMQKGMVIDGLEKNSYRSGHID